MAYLALYRRFRPRGFDGLIGQDHIVKTLKNQINSDRIGHAYLFCGARGTGKTSAAKIFARAINCLSPVDGSPCGECSACKALSDAANLDILEMDAASNNKVENVREIREKIQYPPVSGKYKVYIIDEAHMLTTEAFNALLKTLEEPPKHAVFILATTEVHKLPSTILSRCMRFDFKLISASKIASLIGKIYDEVGKEYDSDALAAIARAGAGSVRDALSIADVCVSYKQGKLTYGDVLEVLGATDSAKITKLVESILSSKSGEALEIIESLTENGKSVGVLCKDIISRLRETIIAKTCPNARDILELPDDVFDEISATAKIADEKRILRTIEIFGEAEGSMRYGTSPKILLECACVKASRPETDYNLDALLSRVSALEKLIEEGGVKFEPKNNCSSDEFSSLKVVEKTSESRKASVSDDGSNADDYIPFDEPVPPPPSEEDFNYSAYKPINKQKEVLVDRRIESLAAEEKSQTTVLSSTRNETPKVDEKPRGSMSAGKIWGAVIRKLRADKQIVLWIACQEMTAVLNGNVLVVKAADEAGYNAATKRANLEILSDAVKSIGDYEVEIKGPDGSDDGKSQFDKDVDKMIDTFGENVVKVKQ